MATVACANGSPARDASLCDAGQQTVFSCSTANGKRLAVCVKAPREVQYRYGAPGKVELAFPPVAQDGPSRLRYAEYHRPLTSRYTLSFANGGFEYVVFDFNEEKSSSAGITVQGADPGKETTISCRGRPAGSLAPLKELVVCDRDSALNLGSCP